MLTTTKLYNHKTLNKRSQVTDSPATYGRHIPVKRLTFQLPQQTILIRITGQVFFLQRAQVSHLVSFRPSCCMEKQ